MFSQRTRHGRPRVAAGRAAALVAAITALATPAVTYAASATDRGSIRVVPGTVAKTSQLPDYYYDHPFPGETPSESSANEMGMTDPVNHLYFEFASQHFCGGPGESPTNGAVYDVDTGRLLATGCVELRAAGEHGLRNATSSQGLTGTEQTDAVADYRDGLLIVPADYGNGFGSSYHGGSPPQVAIFNERTLELVDVWTLPAAAPPVIQGISWSPKRDQLVVTANTGSPASAGPGYPGVSVYAYSVKASLHKGAAAKPLWGYSVTDCTSGVSGDGNTADAYLSDTKPVLVVPCTIGYRPPVSPLVGGAIGSSVSTGVVSVPLGRNCTAPAKECPSGTETDAIAPGQIENFVFDPLGNRGFSLYQSAGAISLFVYDLAQHNFIGRIGIGVIPQDTNTVTFAVDPLSGRVYTGSRTGFHVIDGRRTPIQPGLSFPALGGYFPAFRQLGVVAPDARNPYSRVVVPRINPCTPADCSTLSTIDVYTDAAPITHDPSIASVDSNTFEGQIPHGATLSNSYSVDARGFGVHSDFVGNVDAFMDNNLDPGQFQKLKLPFTSGNNDQLMAEVSRLSLGNGAAAGSAAAVADGSGATTHDFANTTQNAAYPFGVAECSVPGAGHRSSTSDGYRLGQSNDTAQSVPVSPQAHATVDCSVEDGRGARATSYYAGTQASASTVTVGFGDAHTESTVTAPGSGRPTTATASASVQGLRIDLGGGNGLYIGEISQTAAAQAAGRRGTAHATRTVTLGEVVVGAGGVNQVLCAAICEGDPQGVVDRINHLDPGQLQVFLPKPNTDYLHGSPGGYLSGVESEPAEQYGDQSFNGMSTDEAAYLPALRVVLYDDFNDLNREVLDFAGVYANASDGISVLNQTRWKPPAPPVKRQKKVTGVTRQYVPGTPGTPGTPGGALPGNKATGPAWSDQPPLVSGLTHVVERALAGISLIWRNPVEALKIFALLLMFTIPALLMVRRRAWLAMAIGGNR